jgi:hypothetical protein
MGSTILLSAASLKGTASWDLLLVLRKLKVKVIFHFILDSFKTEVVGNDSVPKNPSQPPGIYLE